MVADFVFKNI
jgi:hypothetical protein